MGRTLFPCQSIIKLLTSIVVWIWSVCRLICWMLGSKLQLLSWEDLEARSRSLRSVALKVMPGPDSPPHRLLSFCPWAKEPPLPHVPTVMIFLSKCLGPSNHELDPLKQSEQNQIFPWNRLFYFGHCESGSLQDLLQSDNIEIQWWRERDTRQRVKSWRTGRIGAGKPEQGE